MTRKALAACALLVTAAWALSGCSASPSIQSPNDLANAYVAAGGTCDSRSDRPGGSEPGTWTDCDGATLVLLDSKDDVNEFDGGWVVGDNWVAHIPEEIGTKMGGTPSMCKRGQGCTPVSGS